MKIKTPQDLKVLFELMQEDVLLSHHLSDTYLEKIIDFLEPYLTSLKEEILEEVGKTGHHKECRSQTIPKKDGMCACPEEVLKITTIINNIFNQQTP